MTNLTPNAGWDDVPQLETTTKAMGGPSGPMNLQAQALLNRTERLLAMIYGISVTIERFGGGVNASPTLNSAAFAAAQDYLQSVGGGFIDFGPGVYTFANVGAGLVGGSGSTSWDNRYCCFVKYNGIKLRGRGIGVTVLRLAGGENAHVVKFGMRAGSTITVSGGGLFGIEIDGNRANQALPDPTNNHWSGLDVSSGCTDIRISDFYIHDTLWYGIGMNRDGINNCSIRNGKISNTGVDSIDWKNDSDNAYGNVIDTVYADNWGLLDASVTGDPSAAFDLRSGITATRLFAQTPGISAVNAIRLQNGTPGATPVQATKVGYHEVAGGRVAGSAGVRVISRNSFVGEGRSTNWDDGYSFTEPDCRYENLNGSNNVTSGFRFWNNAAAGTKASTNAADGLIARGNAYGVICDGAASELMFADCDLRGNTTKGADIRTGCSNIRFIGGSNTGNGAGASDGFNDAGASTTIKDVSGYKTYAVVSTTVPIDSTGTKSFQIAHGMPFTPSASDVSLTLTLNTNVGDWVSPAPRVTSVDATYVKGQLPISTASATAGAVVNVVATVASKNR